MQERVRTVNTVLVIEDDRLLQQRVVAYLESHGLVVTGAETVAEARNILRQHSFGAVVLDLTLEGEDGLVIARELAARGGPPVVIISARVDEVDRVLALDSGADDFLVKPFGFRELLSRLRAVQRRTAGPARRAAGRHLAHFDGWTVDLSAHGVKHEDGRSVEMTSGELSLLRAFLDNPVRNPLPPPVAGVDPAQRRRGLRSHRRRARWPACGASSKATRATPRSIQTVRGEGYLFAHPVNWTVA